VLSIWIGPQLDEVAGRRNNFSLNLNYGKEFKKFGYLYTDFSYNGYLKEKKSRTNACKHQSELHNQKY
jgi:hypothetical protein